VDVVSVQHEFGIFGGPAGSHLLELLRELKMLVVTTIPTVLRELTRRADACTNAGGLWGEARCPPAEMLNSVTTNCWKPRLLPLRSKGTQSFIRSW